MFRVFSFTCTYHRRNGRMVTEPDMLEMIQTQSGYRSYFVYRFWGEYQDYKSAIEAVRSIPKSHYQHYIEGTTIDGILYCYEGVVVYIDDRPYVVFGTYLEGGE